MQRCRRMLVSNKPVVEPSVAQHQSHNRDGKDSVTAAKTCHALQRKLSFTVVRGGCHTGLALSRAPCSAAMRYPCCRVSEA